MIVERLEHPLGGIIDLNDLKSHVRVDGDDEDWALQRMAYAAVSEAEDRAQIALRTQAIRVTLDCWPHGARSFRLPIGPVRDRDSVTVTADDQLFEGFTITPGARAELRLTGSQPGGRIEIEYLAGYGETKASIPLDLTQAILDQAAAYYEARGPGDPRRQALSPHFARIIGRYRGVRL